MAPTARTMRSTRASARLAKLDAESKEVAQVLPSSADSVSSAPRAILSKRMKPVRGEGDVSPEVSKWICATQMPNKTPQTGASIPRSIPAVASLLEDGVGKHGRYDTPESLLSVVDSQTSSMVDAGGTVEDRMLNNKGAEAEVPGPASPIRMQYTRELSFTRLDHAQPVNNSSRESTVEDMLQSTSEEGGSASGSRPSSSDGMSTVSIEDHSSTGKKVIEMESDLTYSAVGNHDSPASVEPQSCTEARRPEVLSHLNSGATDDGNDTKLFWHRAQSSVQKNTEQITSKELTVSTANDGDIDDRSEADPDADYRAIALAAIEERLQTLSFTGIARETRADGDYTADERELIRQALVDFKEIWNLDTEDLIDLIHTGSPSSGDEKDEKEEIEALWDLIQNACPKRRLKQLQGHVRAEWHLFKTGKWTEEEDQILKTLRSRHRKDYIHLASLQLDRSKQDVCLRWLRYLKPLETPHNVGSFQQSLEQWEDCDLLIFRGVVRDVLQEFEDRLFEQNLPPKATYFAGDVDWNKVAATLSEDHGLNYSHVACQNKWTDMASSPEGIQMDPIRIRTRWSAPTIPEPEPEPESDLHLQLEPEVEPHRLKVQESETVEAMSVVVQTEADTPVLGALTRAVNLGPHLAEDNLPDIASLCNDNDTFPEALFPDDAEDAFDNGIGEPEETALDRLRQTIEGMREDFLKQVKEHREAMQKERIQHSTQVREDRKALQKDREELIKQIALIKQSSLNPVATARASQETPEPAAHLHTPIETPAFSSQSTEKRGRGRPRKEPGAPTAQYTPRNSTPRSQKPHKTFLLEPHPSATTGKRKRSDVTSTPTPTPQGLESRDSSNSPHKKQKRLSGLAPRDVFLNLTVPVGPEFKHMFSVRANERQSTPLPVKQLIAKEKASYKRQHEKRVEELGAASHTRRKAYIDLSSDEASYEDEQETRYQSESELEPEPEAQPDNGEVEFAEVLSQDGAWQTNQGYSYHGKGKGRLIDREPSLEVDHEQQKNQEDSEEQYDGVAFVHANSASVLAHEQSDEEMEEVGKDIDEAGEGQEGDEVEREEEEAIDSDDEPPIRVRQSFNTLDFLDDDYYGPG